MNKENAKLVNTLIAIATPMDKPVLNVDSYLDSFYRKSNAFWGLHRPSNHTVISNSTNTCCNASNHALTKISIDNSTAQSNVEQYETYFLENILLITIGGGSRDLLVPSALTISRFSDIHTMSSCMPNVWLTTDHLSSTWCLQQTLVINRFLYSIIQLVQPRPRTISNHFIESKKTRIEKAKYYFTQDIEEPKKLRDVILKSSHNNNGEWYEDTRRVFSIKTKNEWNYTRKQMVRLNRSMQYQILNVEAINSELDDVVGCNAVENDGIQRYW